MGFSLRPIPIWVSTPRISTGVTCSDLWHNQRADFKHIASATDVNINMLLHMITRWILSPLELVPSPMVDAAEDKIQAAIDYPPYELPVVAQYCQRFTAPFHGAGTALTFCEMDVMHLAAAQKDARLTIFNTLDDPFPTDAMKAYASCCAVGATAQTLREFLKLMEERHVEFVPAE